MPTGLMLQDEWDAANLAALCSHLLALDTCWTERLRRGEFAVVERKELVSIGNRMVADVDEVSRSLQVAAKIVDALRDVFDRESEDSPLRSSFREQGVDPSLVIKAAHEVLETLRDTQLISATHNVRTGCSGSMWTATPWDAEP